MVRNELNKIIADARDWSGGYGIFSAYVIKIRIVVSLGLGFTACCLLRASHRRLHKSFAKERKVTSVTFFKS